MGQDMVNHGLLCWLLWHVRFYNGCDYFVWNTRDQGNDWEATLFLNLYNDAFSSSENMKGIGRGLF